MTKKYPQIRVRDVDYERLNKLSEKFGWSITQIIHHLLTKETIAIQSKATLERKLEKKIREDLRKEYQTEIANWKGKIEVLEKEKQELIETQQYDIYMLEELKKENASLKEELEKHKNLNYDNVVRDYEKLLEEKKVLETENKTLKEEIEKYRNLDVDSVIAERDKLANEVQILKMDLLEERNRNDNLIKDRNEQAKEIRFMKEEIARQLKKISEMDSVLDIKPQLLLLIKMIEVKADYELSKFEL
jgi:DNA repair exonuclease SbcCD ATPase subunit